MSGRKIKGLKSRGLLAVIPLHFETDGENTDKQASDSCIRYLLSYYLSKASPSEG